MRFVGRPGRIGLQNHLKIIVAEFLPTLFGAIRSLFRPGPYSQFGEDTFILNEFGLDRLRDITYLDIGAGHPVIGSNTYLVYQHNGRGVTVDANPLLSAKHRKLRPLDNHISAAVGSFDGPVDFDISSNWSFSRRSDLGGTTGYQTRIKLTQVRVQPLIDQMQNSAEWIFNLDVEGLEPEILEASDFSKARPKYCFIEVTKETRSRVEKLMEIKGFKHSRSFGMTWLFE